MSEAGNRLITAAQEAELVAPYVAQIETLRAENKRLRAALTRCEQFAEAAIEMCDEGTPISARNISALVIRESHKALEDKG